jgi:hypothetical protein
MLAGRDHSVVLFLLESFLIAQRSVLLAVLLLVEFNSVILRLKNRAIQILGSGVALGVAIVLSKWLPLIQICISLVDFLSFKSESIVAFFVVFEIYQRRWITIVLRRSNLRILVRKPITHSVPSKSLIIYDLLMVLRLCPEIDTTILSRIRILVLSATFFISRSIVVFGDICRFVALKRVICRT